MATPDLEVDSRFPTGRWIGFYLDKRIPGRHQMELILTFQKGSISGEGRDRIGEFILRGRYNTADGQCSWNKRYIGQHEVLYRGFNEGKGIWGTWDIPATKEYEAARGGFHIWPEGMADPTGSHLTEAAQPPAKIDEMIEVEEREFAPAGAPFPG